SAVEGGGGDAFDRLRCGEHSHRKTKSSGAGEQSRNSCRSQQTGKPIHDITHTRCRECPQCQARQHWEPPCCRDPRTRGLESVPVPHARGTYRLAGSAAEAPIEVVGECGVRDLEIAALERPHQLDAAARRIGFISGGEKGGTSLQTEPAMHTRIQPCESSPGPCHEPSVATTRAPPGSNVRRSPETSGPTPTR